MPEFLLRYKVPEEARTESEIKSTMLLAQKMANRIQALVSKIFFGWDVCYEIREFGDTKGMPDFYVTAWVTDNDDAFVNLVKEAELAILATLIQLAPKDKNVGVWFQRVKGVFGKT